MPIGIYGTVPHILTNKNIENKKAALKDSAKEATKGVGKMYLAQVAIAGTGAGTTYAVNKFFPKAAQAIKTKLSTLTSTIGNALSKVTINMGEGVTQNLKEVIKNSGFVDAVRAIPAPIKGAVAAAAVIFPMVGSYILHKTTGNMAALEAKHETKQA